MAGEGCAASTPDQCHVQFGLQEIKPTASEAMAAIVETVERTLAALGDLGIDEPDIQTGGISLHQWSEHHDRGPYAHIATYQLTVRRRPLATASDVIGGVVAAAGDAARVNGIQLAFSDAEPLRSVARVRAVEDARRQAAELAEAAGVTLGPVLALQHGQTYSPMQGVVYRQVGFAQPAAGPAIVAGESEIVATVTMTFAIE